MTLVATLPIKEAVDGLVELLPNLTAEIREGEPMNIDRSSILVPILKNAGFDCGIVIFDPRFNRTSLRGHCWRFAPRYIPRMSHMAYQRSGHINPVASHWLDEFFLALTEVTDANEFRHAIFHRIRSTRNHPLQITADGEAIIFRRLNEEGVADQGIIHDGMHLYDQANFNLWFGTSNLQARDELGRHDYCGGRIGYHRVAQKFGALSCKECQLRIVIPVEVSTWGQLREYFFDRFAEQSIQFS